MSENELSVNMGTTEVTASPPTAPAEKGGIQWDKVIASPAFWPGVILALGIGLVFWPLFQKLPDLWLSKDGYYSHGFLVPLISGFLIYRAWDKRPNVSGLLLPMLALIGLFVPGNMNKVWVVVGMIGLYCLPPTRRAIGLLDRKVFPAGTTLKEMAPKSSLVTTLCIGTLLMIPMYFALVSTSTPIDAIMSVVLVAAILLGVWLVAGFRWMLAITWPIAYLSFALPLFGMAIEIYTNPLQEYSTQVATFILGLSGFEHMQVNSTTVIMNNGFNLNVGVPCSGLRLILALTAFTIFFVLIANLNWWRNLIMIGLILPLSLIINGLRIALIGIVGEMRGPDAGMAFHDYSGYITLIICFIVLFKIARLLGWKD